MANFGTERVYQNFEPATRWTSEQDAEVLVADLPGFKKEQLKVAVTATRKLRLTGERSTGGNKWIRFHQEIPIPLTVDMDSVSAIFKDNKLYIKHPKIKTEIPQAKPLSPVKPLVMMKHSDHHETKQSQGSKANAENTIGGKLDQLKHDAQQKKELVGGKISQLKHDAQQKANAESTIGGKLNQLKHDAQQKKELVGGKIGQLKHDAEQKARELHSGNKEVIGQPKGPLISKDDEKEKIGAKWFEKSKEATGNLVKEAKNKRQLICNLAASISLVLLILLYARNAVRSSLMWINEE